MIPSTKQVRANGLSLALHTWNAGGARRPVLLLHGFMDSGRTFAPVAERLAGGGYRVLAPDSRGFGDSDWASPGGYYHFADYIFDLADLAHQELGGVVPHLVGHSMGGVIATVYAGTFPDRVTSLTLLEGLGPPLVPWDGFVDRMRRWISEVRSTRVAPDETLEGVDDAFRRLALRHPAVDRDFLRQVAAWLTTPAPGGGLRWKADPLHRTTSPAPQMHAFVAFAGKVTCPVTFVSGGPTGYHPPEEEERLAAFGKLTRYTLEDAGHMMHWTKPDALVKLLFDTWGESMS